MRRTCLLPVVLVWLLACGSTSTNVVSPSAVAPPGLPGLRVELRAPTAARYKVSVLGPGELHVGLRMTNVTGGSIVVRKLAVALTASREGVAFPCRATQKGDEREPTSLAAGASFTFERDLACTLPIPGLYALSVYAAAGREPTLGAETDRVGTFSLRIDATQDNAPREIPGSPGLFAVMSGSPFARPLPKGAWAPGAYRVLVGIVNGRSSPVVDLSARIVFRVYRVGDALPCLESPVELRLPPHLESAGVYLERVPITCVIGARGDYDVVGALDLNHGETLLELGRFRIHVTDEPTLDALPPP